MLGMCNVCLDCSITFQVNGKLYSTHLIWNISYIRHVNFKARVGHFGQTSLLYKATHECTLPVAWL